MHEFIPGMVARAEEVNENFAEVMYAKDSDNEIVIKGRRYQRSGVFPSIPSFTYRDSAGWGLGHITLPVPYTPPTGYTFATYVLDSTGFTIAQTCGLTSDKHSIITRIIQGANTDSKALKKIGWSLVKAE